MAKKFKVAPAHLVPELVAITTAGLLTYGLRASQAQIVTITFFPETPGGVTMNASLFVILMALAATLMYLLIRRGLKKIVKYLIRAALFLVVFFLFNWYGDLYSSRLPPFVEVYSPAWYGATAFLTIALLAVVYGTRGLSHIVSVSVIGALTGTFLGASIPTFSAVVLLLALAAYDLYAVYRGPIGKIAQAAELEEFTGAVFTCGDLTVGMGDMVFYSMLASNAMLNFGPLQFLGAAGGLIVGAYIGFKMLEGRDMFPGLPFAIALGLALMFLSNQLLLFTTS